VNPAARELGHQPTFDSARGELSPLRAEAKVSVPQQPLELGGGEVGVGDQPGSVPQHRFHPALPQLATTLGRPAVLPYDSRHHWSQTPAIPEDNRLPLVGDTEPDGPLPRPGERFRHGLQRDSEDFVGVVLDPARLRKVLGEFAVTPAEHPAVLMDDESSGARGPLVEGKDGRHLG
jgi:hypothetical protein